MENLIKATTFEIGKYYKVPTVYCPCFEKPMPVRLPMHHDKEELDFLFWHFHYDFRFFSKQDWADQIAMVKDMYGARFAYAYVLHIQDEDREYIRAGDKFKKPDVVLRYRKFQRYDLDFPPGFRRKPYLLENLKKYVGQKAKNWICPHKGYDLSTAKPNAQGLIVCPCHGLVFDQNKVCVAPCIDN